MGAQTRESEAVKKGLEQAFLGVIRSVDGDAKVIVTQPVAPEATATDPFRVPSRGTTIWVDPAAGKNVRENVTPRDVRVRQPVPTPGQPAVNPSSSEDRISNLEAKLNAILKELESLRKEMKTQPKTSLRTTDYESSIFRELLGHVITMPPAEQPVPVTKPSPR